MLGRHLKIELELLGHEIFAPTSLELDLRDSIATFDFMDQTKPEALIHCAAVVGGIQANIAGGGRFLTENLEIDHSVFFAARKVNVKNLIYVGSSCMYPANRMEPLGVSDLLSGPLEPTNASYALAKITGTKTVEAFDSIDGNNWKVFVASNLYGPGDHFEPERSHLLAAIISKVHQAKITNSNQVIMWGEGKAKREFTYVIDFAKWLAESVSNLHNFPSILNVGCGEDFTVREFYDIAMRELEFEGELVADISKPSGNARKLMDSTVARGLGWKPSTTINQGITETYRWYTENLNNV